MSYGTWGFPPDPLPPTVGTRPAPGVPFSSTGPTLRTVWDRASKGRTDDEGCRRARSRRPFRSLVGESSRV